MKYQYCYWLPPASRFWYSKKCKKRDEVLLINASEHGERGKHQKQLADEHIVTIIETYRNRTLI